MSKLKIKLLADRVLVEPLAAETKTASGIIIPDSAVEKSRRGTVVAVGPGTKDNPVTVKEGDVVLHTNMYPGSEIKLEEKEYIIMKENDIIAILL